MRLYFFSVLLFILFVSGIKQLQANAPKYLDFRPREFVEQGGENSPGSRKLKIAGRALKAEDILVREGTSVTVGQVLITRQFEINQLNSTKAKLQERLKYLESRVIVKPEPPVQRDYPALPPASFEAEELKIAAIAIRCERLQASLADTKNSSLGYFSKAAISRLEQLKQQKARELAQAQDLLNNLRSLNFGEHYLSHQAEKIKQITQEMQQLDADILVSTGELQERISRAEAVKNDAIARLEANLTDCQQQLSIARADLLGAQHRRQILEQNYQQSLAVHLQEQTKTQQDYQRDLNRYNEQVQSQQLAIFAAKQEIAQIDLQVSEITEVKSPYAGQISKVKVRSSSDGYLNVEFVLLY